MADRKIIYINLAELTLKTNFVNDGKISLLRFCVKFHIELFYFRNANAVDFYLATTERPRSERQRQELSSSANSYSDRSSLHCIGLERLAVHWSHHSDFSLTGLDTEGSFWVTANVRPKFFPINPSFLMKFSLNPETFERYFHLFTSFSLTFNKTTDPSPDLQLSPEDNLSVNLYTISFVFPTCESLYQTDKEQQLLQTMEY